MSPTPSGGAAALAVPRLSPSARSTWGAVSACDAGGGLGLRQGRRMARPGQEARAPRVGYSPKRRAQAATGPAELLALNNPYARCFLPPSPIHRIVQIHDNQGAMRT